MTPDRCRAVLVDDASSVRCLGAAGHCGPHAGVSAGDGFALERFIWRASTPGAASLVPMLKPRKLSALLAGAPP